MRTILAGSAAVLVCLAGQANAAPALYNPKPLSATGNAHLLCPAGRLDPARVVLSYYVDDTVAAAFPAGPADLQQAFKTPGAQQGQRKAIVDAITQTVYAALTLPKSGFQVVSPPADLDAAGFLAGTTDLSVMCGKNTVAPPVGQAAGTPANPTAGTPAGQVPAPAAVPPGPAKPAPSWYDSIRVRGTTDALLVAPGSENFAAAAAATLSLSQNGPTKTTTNALETAIGYDFNVTSSDSLAAVDIIPFVAVDRNVTDTAGKLSASSRENVMLGGTGSLANIFTLPGGHVGTNILSATYEHLWNDIDTSQLNFIHFVEQPFLNGILNDFIFFPRNVPLDQTWFAISPVFDLRGDIGLYTDHGLKPATTRNYQQFGTDFGLTVSIPKLASVVSVTQTYMAQTQNTRNAISLFDVEYTYNLSKNFGLKASYQNGDLETTAQRIEQWLISLSVKY